MKNYLAIVLLACTIPCTSQDYFASVEKWHHQRIEDLKAENGWLNLAGLFWLAPGTNSFGTASQCDVRFPAGTIAEKAGTFTWLGPAVTMRLNAGLQVAINGKQINSGIIYHPDSTHQPVVSSGALRWTVIKRGDKLGIRLRDVDHPALKTFKGIDRFAVDSNWRVVAQFIPAASHSLLSITNVLGQTSEQKSPGKLVFSLQGNNYSLETLEGGDDELFVVFGDATSGNETYESGRFLYVPKPANGNETVVDFNKAINPPCVFTEHATCPLPPAQNILPFAVTAGEMDYKKEK